MGHTEGAPANGDFMAALKVLRVASRFLVGATQTPIQDVVERDVSAGPGASPTKDTLKGLLSQARRAGIPLEKVDGGRSLRLPREAVARPAALDAWCRENGADPAATRRACYRILMGAVGDPGAGLPGELTCAALHLVGDSYEGLSAPHARALSVPNRHVRRVVSAWCEGVQVKVRYRNARGEERDRAFSVLGVFGVPDNPGVLYFQALDAGDPGGEPKTFRFDKVVRSELLRARAQEAPDGAAVRTSRSRSPFSPSPCRSRPASATGSPGERAA